MATAARLSPPLLAGTARLCVGFPVVMPQGSRTGLIIRPTGTLDASLLSGISIRTYQNSVPKESFTLASLVDLNVLNATAPAQVEFVAGANFDQVELRATGLVNASVDLFLFEAYAYASPLPLPVELTAFQGSSTAAGVVLTWQTASEHNSSHFVIERMDGSQEAFRAIGRVEAAGTSPQPHSYRFVDAAAATVNYYRLRQVDRDGQATFSPVVVMKTAPPAGLLTVYPNPVVETLTATGSTGAQLEVVDQLGRQVRRIKLTARPLDLRGLPDGTYFLRDAATGQSTKFEKAAGLVQ